MSNDTVERGATSHLTQELDALSKRHGLFVIPMHLLNSNHSSVLKIMAKCIIYRAEAMYLKNHIEYVARSECFEEVKEGEYMPEYVWTVNENGEVSAKRRSI